MLYAYKVHSVKREARKKMWKTLPFHGGWLESKKKTTDLDTTKQKKRADKNKIPRVSVESEMNGGQ